jgi:ribosomal protein S27E
MDEVDHDLLTTLESVDIEVAGVTQAHLAAMAAEAGHVRVSCNHCDAPQVIDDKLLATEVECGSCEKTYQADWGEPVAELPAPPTESDAASRQ